MNLYVTTSDIKSALGIPGSAQDTKINLFNQIATGVVNDILQARDLDLHLVTDEVRDSKGKSIYLNDPHVVAVGRILDDGIEHSQDEEFDIVSSTVNLETPVYSGDRKLKVTYAAGWSARYAVKLTVSDLANIAAAATITIGTFTITRGTSWIAGATESEEATNIAAAINAITVISPNAAPTFQAFSCGKFVFVQDEALGGTATAVSTSDAVRLKFDSVTTTVDFPESIKLAVYLYIGSLLSSPKNPRIKQYTIGAKTVTFSDSSQFTEFKSALDHYKRARVLIV